jgi:hypothetical protein
MRNPLVLAVVAASALSLAGCGILFPSAKMRATKNTPGFRAGFTDGCAAASAAAASDTTGTVRDQRSYDTDKSYRAGWASGLANCRTQNSPSPDKSPVPDNSPGGGRQR